MAELLINVKTVPDSCEESGKIVRSIVTVRSVSKAMVFQLCNFCCWSKGSFPDCLRHFEILEEER